MNTKPKRQAVEKLKPYKDGKPSSYLKLRQVLRDQPLTSGPHTQYQKYVERMGQEQE